MRTMEGMIRTMLEEESPGSGMQVADVLGWEAAGPKRQVVKGTSQAGAVVAAP